MRIPGYKRIETQNFDDQYKDLVSTFGGSLNYQMEQYQAAFNKQISFTDNIQCTVKDVELTVDSTGNPTTQTVFKLDTVSIPVKGCQVINAVNLDNSSTYPTSQPFISFTQNN